MPRLIIENRIALDFYLIREMKEIIFKSNIRVLKKNLDQVALTREIVSP